MVVLGRESLSIKSTQTRRKYYFFDFIQVNILSEGRPTERVIGHMGWVKSRYLLYGVASRLDAHPSYRKSWNFGFLFFFAFFLLTA